MILTGNAHIHYSANKLQEIVMGFVDTLGTIIIKLEPVIVVVFASLLAYKLATYQEPKA